MDYKKSDIKILWEITVNYIIRDKEVRKMIIPALAACVISKLLYVKSSESSSEITKKLHKHESVVISVIIFGMCLLFSGIISELGKLYICKARHIGYSVANRKAYEYFLNLHPDDFKNTKKGEMQNIIQRKADAIKNIIDVLTLNLLPFFVTTTIACVSIILKLGIVVNFIVLFTIAIYIVATIQITIWRNKLRIKINSGVDTSQNMLNDGIGNYETIFTCGTEEYEAKRYGLKLKATQRNDVVLSRSMYLLNIVQGAIWALQLFAVVFTGCVLMKSLEANDITYVISLLSVFHKELNNLGYMYGLYKEGMINIKRTYLPTRVKKIENGLRLGTMQKQMSIYDLNYAINNKKILDNCNFTINKGDKIALIGHNGAGKSTLLKSLLKLNHSESQMYIDDINVDTLNEKDFKNLIAYVSQSASLFNETVMYNIKYSNKNVYEEQIYKAAMHLGIHESIKRLENGYYTMCGESGNNLSGGERQKIALLRAYLKGSSIMLLDEPTASMDRKSEEEVLDILFNDEKLTILVIPNSKKVLNRCNRVFMVEDMNVIENSK